jgi:hypothetical protein
VLIAWKTNKDDPAAWTGEKGLYPRIEHLGSQMKAFSSLGQGLGVCSPIVEPCSDWPVWTRAGGHARALAAKMSGDLGQKSCVGLRGVIRGEITLSLAPPVLRPQGLPCPPLRPEDRS